MSKKVINLTEVRQKNRQKSGWTIEEIRERAAQERALYKGLAENEPDDLASGGDMKKILEEKGDD